MRFVGYYPWMLELESALPGEGKSLEHRGAGVSPAKAQARWSYPWIPGTRKVVRQIDHRVHGGSADRERAEQMKGWDVPGAGQGVHVRSW